MSQKSVCNLNKDKLLNIAKGLTVNPSISTFEVKRDIITNTRQTLRITQLLDNQPHCSVEILIGLKENNSLRSLKLKVSFFCIG